MLWAGLLAGVCACIQGCSRGPELGQVEGTVRLDDQPVAEARVTFQPDRGAASYAETDADGRYVLTYAEDQPGAIIGRHMVMIETYRYRADEEGNPIERPERFPRRFNSETELTREVKTGSQTFDFNLPSE